MTSSFEVESPDGVTKVLEQIKASFKGKLRVTVTTLPEGETVAEEEDYIDYLIRNPLPPFTPLTRDEANDRYY